MQALSWKPLKVGGGGFTRDLDIADDIGELADESGWVNHGSLTP